MSSLSLQLLGEFQAHLDDQLISGFRTNKVQALLAYLLAEPEQHSRDSLLELLWPGMPERSARHNLRQVLYYLRKAIPSLASRPGENGGAPVPLLLTSRHTIRLNPDAAVTIDVAQFEALLKSVQAHDHLDLLGCPGCQENLEAAVALYQGEFLADFFLSDSNEFEDWAQMTRQAYRRQALDALEVLTTIATRARDYPVARALAERQLDIDNLRESSYRQLMEVLALSGRREEALAIYESCRRLLAEELSMEPAQRTTATYEKILAGDLSFERAPAQGVRGYELKEEIGAGAHGTIHRAIQPAVGREVAIKVIHHQYANDPEFIRRFEDEAQIVARLEHPFVVPLYDYWRDADGAYLVMRYLKGGNLLTALEKGPWNAETALAMLDQVTPALAAAHRMGIIHRDIKPANILFDESGNAYLSDFSIAKRMDRERRLTAAGGVLGTPDYISPEQILDEQVGPQTDLYSLGAVLYETLTGEKPFGTASLANLIYKHINEPIPLVSASRPDLPPEIDTVIQKATAKRPSNRYADAIEMAAAFRRALVGSPQSPAFPPVHQMGIELYNPYKGLRPFQEADSDDFFGRDALIDRLVARLAPEQAIRGGERNGTSTRFLAVVGPSGSGKSSTIKAGLIPALRAGAIPGSEKWFVVEMVPGTHPLEELEMALWPVAVDAPPSLVAPMQRDVRGMLRTIRRILPEGDTPDGNAQLLLVIDQFEELFTLVTNEERRTFFLDSLLAAISAPRSPLHVVITLRADFYDRPLQYQSLGTLIKHNAEVVLPLIPEELTWAVREPARHVGVRLEEGLTEAIIADVIDQPGGLPLLQYALTELFERRRGNQMTLEAYEEIGGVSGALGRRAEALYADLDPAGQEIARQLFLRLVTLGEGVEDTRRRVLRSELETIASHPPQAAAERAAPDAGDGNDNVALLAASVIDRFGAARLLTFDRNVATRQPTVEVAHEALLREWPRLRAWLAESRDDVRLQRLLARAVAEWLTADQDESYLLRGTRLSQFEGRLTTSRVALTTAERTFLETSIARREERLAEEETRQQRQLETAQRLAAAEKARAEAEAQRATDQAGAASRLRRLALVLAGVVVVAVALAVLAVRSGQDASRNAGLAATRAADAVEQQALTEELAHISQSRELAAAADKNLDTDPELSLLLALEAMNVEHTIEAESSLHHSLLASRVRQRLVASPGQTIQRVAYSPDGSLIAVAAWEEGVVSIWEADSGRRLHEIPVGGCCFGLYFDERGQYLAATEDGAAFSIGVWDVSTGEKHERLILPIPTGEVVFYALEPAWNQVAVTLWTGQAEIWDLRGGEKLFELNGHEGPAEIEYSADGSRLVSQEWASGQVIVWDPQTGEALRTMETGLRINDHAVSPDGRRVALGTQDGGIQIWDAEAPVGDELEATMDGHDTILFLLAFSPDGRRLASASSDGTARVWDVTTGDELAVLPHGAQVRSVVFHPDGDRILTGDWEGNARVWDVTPQGATERLTLPAHNEVRAVAFSPDGQFLVTGGWDGLAKIWDRVSGEVIHTLEGHAGFAGAAAYHPDGRRVATGDEDGTVRIWDPRTGQVLATLTGHTAGNVGGVFTGVMEIAFSPNGERLATAGADGTLRFWDVNSGDELLVLRASGGLASLAFSPDGRFLATGVDNPGGTVIVRDATTGAALALSPLSHGTTVFGLSFSPDGRLLATSGGDTNVKVWALDYESGRAELLLTLESHASSVMRVRFSPDGQLLASATRSELRVWDVSDLTTGTGDGIIPELLLLSGGPGLAFSPDGRELVSGGLDGLVHFYLMDTEAVIALARSRLTRGWTERECQQYLHVTACPARLSG